MKKRIAKKCLNWLTTCAVVLACIPAASADSEMVGGVEWSYDVSAGEATVAGAEPAAGNLAIPSSLGGYPVTGIGNSAFENRENLVSVAFPEGVRRIGRSAFYGCSGLTSVSLPEGLKRIESSAFYHTGLETVTVPKSARWIGGSAFAFCPLRSATILGGAISGSDGAFTGCNSLKTLTLGTRVSGISYYAFANYSSRWTALETVHAPVGWEGKPCPLSGGFFGADFTIVYDNEVDDGEPTEEAEEYEDVWNFQVVDGEAVLGMYSEVGGKVVIPSTLGGCPVTAIADFAFYYDGDVITSLRIPDSVRRVGAGALRGCSGLATLYVPASWEGTAMLDNAGVPEGCTIVYCASPQEDVTTTGVPYAWLEENAPEILAANGGDHEAAAKAPAANGRPVWECYVADVSVTNAAEDFKTVLVLEDGQWVPKPSPDRGGTRAYTVQGASELGGEESWGPVTDDSRFFRVKVALPE